MRFLILILALFVGCATPMTNIGELFPESQKPTDFIAPTGERFIFNDQNKTIDSFLRYHFTEDAYYYLKEIPLVDGPCYEPYAAGVNGWANMASLLSFNGVGRKVIINRENITRCGEVTLIHEYMHHLDDLTRDGEAALIDYKEFKEAYSRLAKEHRVLFVPNGTRVVSMKVFPHLDKIKNVESFANRWFTNTFGVGPMAEHIAYSTQFILGKSGVPDYFNRVFRKVLKKYQNLK